MNAGGREAKKLEHTEAVRASPGLQSLNAPPQHSHVAFLGIAARNPAPKTPQYSMVPGNEFINRAPGHPTVHGKHILQSIEGWGQTQLRLLDAHKYGNLSHRDPVEPATVFEGTALESAWHWVYIRMDGWILQMWEHRPRGSAGGFNPMFLTHGVSNDHPLAWIDMRCVHRVDYDHVKLSPEWVCKHAVVCSTKTGGIEFRFKSKEDARQWVERLHAIAFDRSIQGDNAATVKHRGADLDARFEKLRSVWWRCVCRIAQGMHVMTSDTIAVIELYREFDDNGDNNLSTTELASMIREQLLMRRHLLMECMEKHERRLNVHGMSFITRDGIRSHKRGMHPQDQRLCQVASELLRSFDVQLDHRNLQKLTTKLYEALDLGHDGRIQLRDFKNVSPSVLFGEADLQREGELYNASEMGNNPLNDRPWDHHQNMQDIEIEATPRESSVSC